MWWKRTTAMAMAICVLDGGFGCDLLDRLLSPEKDGIVCQWDEDGNLDCTSRFETDD